MIWVQHPAWLWIGLALAAAVLMLALRLRRRSWRWLLAGLILPGASALCVTLALAGTTLAIHSHVALLLDYSPSTSHSPWHDPAWVQAQRHLAPGQRLSVIACSGRERHVLLADATSGDLWPTRWDWDPSAPSPGEETRLIDTTTPANGAAQWVITDGLLPAIPADPKIAWTIVPPGAPDAAIRDLQLRAAGPNRVEALVQMHATGLARAATARVIVTRDGQPIADQPVEFQPVTGGSGMARWLSVTDQLPTDAPHHYAATISLPGDAWPQNDRAAAVWPGAAAQRTLIVSDTPIALPGTVVKAGEFHANATQLAAEGWQVVVLNDIPAESTDPARPALSAAAARALDSFVRDDGGGLVLLATKNAFGPGRYGEGSIGGDILEALAPVASHPPQDDLAVLFLLDASSSMNDAAPGMTERKITLLSRAVQSAATYLAPQDEVTVVTFNASAEVQAQGNAEQVMTKLGTLLAGVHPAGATNPDAALPAVRQFMQLGARRLVIFVTDGEIPAMNVAAWKAALQTANTRLAIVAPRHGTGADAGPLAELAAAPQVTWSQTDNPGAWAQALRESILAQTRGSVQTTPLPWQAENLSGTAPSWTRTWRKAEATDLAAAPGSADVPVAAVAQRGLGKVAALTITDDGSAPYQGLRDRLVQAVAATPGDRRFTVTARRAADGRWLIAADGAAAGTFLDGERLTVRTLGDDPTPNAAPMKQTAPGHYEALLPPAPEGLAAVVERQGSAAELVARVQAPAVETTEWPATMDPAAIPPGITVLSPEDQQRWLPERGLSLAPWLWTVAATAALAALWVRQS